MENRKDFSLKEIYRRETFSEMSQFQCEFRTLISVLVYADLWKPLIILPNWLDASTLAPFTRFRYGTSKCDRRNWKSRNRVETKSSCENPKNFSHIKIACEKILEENLIPLRLESLPKVPFSQLLLLVFLAKEIPRDERRKLNRQDVELGRIKNSNL